MHARCPAEAVKVLNLLLKFFGNGERWVKGYFSDRHGNRGLVGALDFVGDHQAIKDDTPLGESGAGLRTVLEIRWSSRMAAKCDPLRCWGRGASPAAAVTARSSCGLRTVRASRWSSRMAARSHPLRPGMRISAVWG
jgi:hypothetical protein